MSSGAAFSAIAAQYDRLFTDTLIGRAQRDAVWKVLGRTFTAGDRVLELNCGTGEDARFLASRGVSVLACDISAPMVALGQARLDQLPVKLPVEFRELATERIGELAGGPPFDGAFSDFAGLNCVADLEAVATSLAALVKPGGRLVLCLCSRWCLVEILYHLGRGDGRKALRRCRGRAQARLEGLPFTVYYPTVHQLRRVFAPRFRLRSWIGIGVAVPPSYLEGWVRGHPTLFRLLCRLERWVARLPMLRGAGDHVLLCLERTADET